MDNALIDATKVGDVAHMEALLESGADIEARDEEEQRTPLFIAIKSNSASLVTWLIQHKVDVNAPPDTIYLNRSEQLDDRDMGQISEEIYPIDHATLFNEIEIVKLLFKRGRANSTKAVG